MIFVIFKKSEKLSCHDNTVKSVFLDFLFVYLYYYAIKNPVKYECICRKNIHTLP